VASESLDAPTFPRRGGGSSFAESSRSRIAIDDGVLASRSLLVLDLAVDDHTTRRRRPFSIATSWFETWLLRDTEWDWTNLMFEEYARLSKKGVEEFAHVAVDDPDLSGLRDSGGELLFSHGSDDQAISSQGSRQCFDRVLEQIGGVSATNEFARFFLCPGDGHSARIQEGFGVDLGTGMIAMMNWVENRIAPDTLDALHYADDSTTVDGVRSITAYGTQLVTS